MCKGRVSVWTTCKCVLSPSVASVFRPGVLEWLCEKRVSHTNTPHNTHVLTSYNNHTNHTMSTSQKNT
eukprot:m.490625 g.490625  ORF g.490625 m.490625 type:complete len:68 (+) comp28400_c0_seq1:214-417(+)